MTQARLHRTDKLDLQWVFLNPDDLLYLAGFREMESAVAYAGYNGYSVDDPPFIKMEEIDAAQPPVEDPPMQAEPPEPRPAAQVPPRPRRINSAIPDLRAAALKPKAEPEKIAGGPRIGFKAFGPKR